MESMPASLTRRHAFSESASALKTVCTSVKRYVAALSRLHENSSTASLLAGKSISHVPWCPREVSRRLGGLLDSARPSASPHQSSSWSASLSATDCTIMRLTRLLCAQQ
jgi:hypothetical protein